jgi:hypothetical protein
MQLIFQHEGHLRAPQLKQLLDEHLRGFQEMFGANSA